MTTKEIKLFANSGGNRDRIKSNIRVVSPTRKIPNLYINSDQTRSDSRLSSASSTRNAKSARRLSRIVNGLSSRKSSIAFNTEHRPSLARSITLPYFEEYDIKKIHEETRLKKQFRKALTEFRCHTTPSVAGGAELTEKKLILKKLDGLSLLSKDKNDYIYDILPDVTEDEKSYLFNKRKKSVEQSGLWQMASASMYEHKARKSRDFGDACMALLSRKLAVDRMREKISKQLELPGDRFRRISILRSNVYHIENKFKKLGRSSSNSRMSVAEASQDVDLVYCPPRFKREGEAVAFFRKCARIILIVLKWIDLIMNNENTSLERELKSFIDIAGEVEDTQGLQSMGDLTFDKNVYKANKEISLTQEHRTILTTRWNFRTPDMVKQVMHGLQALRSLSEYPLQTQEKLCKVAWYQRIGPKKAIVRQGHHAESFYFILSGTAYVKKLMQDPKTGDTRVNTIARLSKGQSFGEIGLLFNSLRTATVESATDMELLVVGKEDFSRIFMKAEDPDIEPEHVTFLREIPLLKNWPLDMLKDEPGTCLLHYFKRGTLITDDNKKSDWLYFVRTGTCEVLKKLRNVKPRSPSHVNKKTDPLYDIILPQLNSEATSRVNTGNHRKRQKIVMNTEVFEEMAEYYEKLKRTLTEKAAQDKAKTKVRLQLPKLSANSQSTRIVLAGQSDSSNSDSSDNGKEEDQDDDEEEILLIPPHNSDIDQTKRLDDNEGFSKSKFCKIPAITQAHFMLPTSAMIQQEKPPAVETAKNGDAQSRPTDVYVRLEVLQAKDIFGLNTLCGWGSNDIDDMLKDSPKVCLVSRGAEVVMLSKKVFLRYLNDRVKIQLRDVIRPYPKESILQENFQIKSDWELYKKSIISDQLCEIQDLRVVV